MFVEVCRSSFLDNLSRRIFVISILCPFDVLSIVVLSVSHTIKANNIHNRHFSCSCSDTVYSKRIKKNRKKTHF